MSEECCGDPGDCAGPCGETTPSSSGRRAGWTWIDESYVFASDEFQKVGTQLKDVLETTAQRAARDEEIALSHNVRLGVVICIRCHHKQGNSLGDDVFYVGCTRCNHPYARHEKKVESA